MKCEPDDRWSVSPVSDRARGGSGLGPVLGGGEVGGGGGQDPGSSRDCLGGTAGPLLYTTSGHRCNVQQPVSGHQGHVNGLSRSKATITKLMVAETLRLQ